MNNGDPIMMGELFIGRACEKCVTRVLERHGIIGKPDSHKVEISVKDLRGLLTQAHRIGRTDSREQRQLIKAASGMSEAALFDHA